MKYYVYSINDNKTTFGAPFVEQSDAAARRGFSFAFQNQQSLVCFSPSDFSLYRIGSFENLSGKLTPCVPEYICSASDFLKMKGDDIVEE